MKATVAAFSSTFLIIIVSLTGAICRQDTCNFDNGLCGWVQGDSDAFNWTRFSGNRSIINTGPTSGHTSSNDTQDYYMIIETTGRKKGDKAVLERMGFDHEGRACLSFWYHMYGLHTGTLNINVIKNGDSPLLVWSKNGSQSENWIHAAVDLEIGSNATIEFEAIRGNGIAGNMALDDVSLTYESCFNCVFDDDFCLWKENKGWQFSPNEAKSGMYATTHASQGCVPYSGVNRFLGIPVQAMQGPVCISFLYFLNGSDNRLQLYINSQDNEYVKWNGSSSNTWRIISVFVNKSFPNFTLVFEMYPGPSCLGETGLKNVTVVMGECQGLHALQATCSTVISKTTSHPSVSEFPKTSPTDFIDEKDHTKISDAAIIGSVVGSLVFVMVLFFGAVCIFRTRRQKLKRTDFIEFQTISSKLSESVREVENNSNPEHSVNTGFIQSSNISHINDTSTVHFKVAMENYSYVDTFVAKPTYGADNTYDNNPNETKPCLDSTYDHLTTHYSDLCDKKYESDDVSCSTSDANQAYDHVTKSREGVYDETYMTTQGTDDRDETYEHVTINTC
ncbi:hypothetical protein CHS0354_003859 [Potamilus streckersoni]|uniref:MAM domain-containing protein n=1 Tax=Potamilus streckersoni TaxID=2493646 RepID=A0AAE0VW01_9BIVA|nr:hypothetical protein CHS0354_003859 [Potamilus streckersoni]